MLWITGWVQLLAAIAALGLAAAVLRASSANRLNRLLAALLAAEGIFQAIWAYAEFEGGFSEGGPPSPILGVGFFASYVASTLYFVFLSKLDTPFARPFRNRFVRFLLVALVGVVAGLHGSVIYRTWRGETLAGTDIGLAFGPVFLALLLSSLYGLVVAISAYRHAPESSVARSRALSFAFGFGGRDLCLLIHLAAGPVLGNLAPDAGYLQSVLLRDVIQSFLGWATIVFVGFVTFGILRSQLFDLELRVKLGISRGTVVSMILVTVFVVAKVVETYLNRTVGFVAGSFIAGALLFLTPRLNKIGDKVADVAMPKVQPTSDYLAFKKLEVYRAAVEAAQETGGISDKDRASLARLRAKLGLKEPDTTAVEAEVLAAPPVATA